MPPCISLRPHRRTMQHVAHSPFSLGPATDCPSCVKLRSGLASRPGLPCTSFPLGRRKYPLHRRIQRLWRDHGALLIWELGRSALCNNLPCWLLELVYCITDPRARCSQGVVLEVASSFA